jgi:hypothetical protein
MRIAWFWWAAGITWIGGGVASAQTVDYNRDVRPVLALHCFKCHGPDDGQRMAGLRLDARASAVGVLASGHRAAVPGRPEQSEIVRRIFAAGPGLMPPVTANKPLRDAEKQILKRWIAGGAVYKPHWAFVPPHQAPLPKVRQAHWPHNPIDTFILARLEREGLHPAPEADRYTLVRRVSLDLIGLPPTPEEADAFVNDRRPDAYERLVDRLLASPHYGERWARRWLDLARYADTNGYEKDRPRPIWPYRDWVINALNRDMPFDRFTVEQIAGDMLPNATQDQKIATGFHRNTMLNEEGGIDPQEFRFHAMTDRMATTGTAWLGLTVGCAQCHSHKYDPITQKEYYRFMAFLNNADEPEMDVVEPDVARRRNEMQAQIDAREAGLATKFPGAVGMNGRQHLEQAFQAWLRETEPKAVHWTVLRPTTATSNSPRLKILDDSSVLSVGDISKRDVFDVAFHTDLKGITAIRLEVLPDDSLPGHGPGRVFYEGAPGDFFLSELTLTADGTPVKFTKAAQSIGNAQNAIDGDNLTGWSINGGQGKVNTATFTVTKPFTAATFALNMVFEQYYASSLGHFRVSVTTDPGPPLGNLPPDVEEVLLIPTAQRSAAQSERLRGYYLSIAPELKGERDAIQKLRDQLPAFQRTLVFRERAADNPRPCFVRHRGEYLKPEQQVGPGIPAFLPQIAQGVPLNRLTLARWLVAPNNPLTARVAVNRQWAALFGRGIVQTTEDFGYQGQPPSHPELLDWLAVEFMKEGWSLKKLHRLIVLSATYRQSSRGTPEARAKDPQNRLLSHAPRVRLEAELVRDSALTISGLLSHKIGGPSVFPPQPASVSSEGAYGALTWTVSQGEDRYRRGLYTFSKRTAPYAMFTTFDAPSGEACVARREISNTPLQALTLLNDQVFLEAAQALGTMLATRPGSPAERATYLFRRCVTRPPTPDELSLLTRYYDEVRQRFASKELDAATVAGKGEGDAVERAAWTALSRSLLNLDEVVTRG